eukprot:c18076_g1_i1.p1 GENE.c18076_g1_i1~~c18076_g1_i1.p1  ORF type:complete len:571 (+),score=160.63 c18076_g1_i1:90-1715(+)
MSTPQISFLDGESLTPFTLIRIANKAISIDLTKDAWARVERGRKVIDDIVASGQVVYGVNTGFGNFAQVRIDANQLDQLQINLIRSHCCGVGEPITYERTRSLAVLRVNVFAKGCSGIRPETVRTMIALVNKGCLPVVPEKGTVGASGDLAPLAHLALGFMGEGEMWDPMTKQKGKAADIIAAHGLTPITLRAKEGLAMINGTTFISALGCEALVRCFNVFNQAQVVAAMSLEALRGSVRAFNPRIHHVRPHKGQLEVASVMRQLLHGEHHQSAIARSHANCDRVQDSYTLRCIPQIHGVCLDTLRFVEKILTVEINSATDNPMVFSGGDEEFQIQEAFKLERVNDGPSSFTISGGNFHGEYPAKACDFLAIGIHEIASVSERRIERLVNPALSHGLPAFLVKAGGLNSGYMIAHVAAAALVSENKALCMPASVDTIPTSAGQEDHVSMGGWAARKALIVVEHTETVVAIELLCACQAIDFLRPLTTTPALEAVHKLVRDHITHYDQDRILAPDIALATHLLRSNAVAAAVHPFISPKSAL